MDVEGSEYNLLRRLAMSGLGRTRRIFVGIEWHRPLKERALRTGAIATHLSRLDRAFDRAGAGRQPATGRTPNTGMSFSLMEQYEKVLTHMLNAANITVTELTRHKSREALFHAVLE